MSDIPIVLAVEDVLSEAVVREMLKQSERLSLKSEEITMVN